MDECLQDEDENFEYSLCLLDWMEFLHCSLSRCEFEIQKKGWNSHDSHRPKGHNMLLRWQHRKILSFHLSPWQNDINCAPRAYKWRISTLTFCTNFRLKHARRQHFTFAKSSPVTFHSSWFWMLLQSLIIVTIVCWDFHCVCSRPKKKTVNLDKLQGKNFFFISSTRFCSLSSPGIFERWKLLWEQTEFARKGNLFSNSKIMLLLLGWLGAREEDAVGPKLY